MAAGLVVPIEQCQNCANKATHYVIAYGEIVGLFCEEHATEVAEEIE